MHIVQCFANLTFEMKKRAFSLLFLFLAFLLISAATFREKTGGQPPQLQALVKEQQWVDSLFQAMTPGERLGQLFWLRAQSDWSQKKMDLLAQQIRQYHPGGLCFFNPTGKGTPEKQVELTNRYQALSPQVPLMISIDGEWGIGWRYKGKALAFPRQLMLGAIQDDKLIYQMGAEIARHCKRMGIHVNFAPVADVNNNAANPVINYRSFGEAPYNVAAKAYMYMKGMQDHGIMACAKHFPGHGDTNVDSHRDLPVIPHTRARLDSVELFPFKILAEQGAASVMVAHLEVPALDATKGLPTSLSRPVITGVLKDQLHFNGLVLTDALEMKGVTKNYKPGEVEALALAAGNDVLLLPSDLDAGFKTVKAWLRDGRLDSSLVYTSVKKVLRWKYRMGLTSFEPISTEGLRADLSDNHAKTVKRSLIQNALTLVRNEGDLLPLKDINSLDIAALGIGGTDNSRFLPRLQSYADISLLTCARDISSADNKDLFSKLKDKDLVIVSLRGMSQSAAKNWGLKQSAIDFIKKLRSETRVVLVVFGNPYALKYFDDVGCVLEAYDAGDDIEDLAAQALFGAFPIQGRLPVTASPESRGGTGVITPSLQRLSYGLPEEVGMSSARLLKIDTLVREAIDSQATPGAVVLVAKDGKVVFQKAFGRHTYEKEARRTQVSDIFDLASVTKIAATTVSLMKLQDDGKFNVNDPVEKYLHEFANTNKAGIPMLDMLTHRARLTTWIRFYEATISKKAKPLPKYYSDKKSEQFPYPVAKDLWMRADYPDTIWQAIRESPLLETEEYKYSDLAFYIAGEIVRRLSGQHIEDYARDRFYEPLGMRTTTYRPLEKFPLDRMPPTEEDSYFRDRRIQGYVHDMGAAMLNGATGHAGLFSDANDLAILMQMLLNKGSYGGRQYLKPETIHQYANRCGKCTRRGIGFDMRQTKEGLKPNLSTLAGDNTFGHLGFTGNAVWADPDNNLVYIFLSNRTYPSMHNYKLKKMNTRVKVQDAVYEALEKLP
ncbi:MAG: glycoside hydrolase family 3 N-terminal domain-containing protein [Saprospiraceae bacterium]